MERDGACRVHADLPAIAACPSCGAPACPLCWHTAAARCTACLAREPGGDAPPIPWETPGRSAIVRFVLTLAGTFAPARTAPSFGRRGQLLPAFYFALLSVLPPVAVLSAIENTFTLVFAPGARIRVVGAAVPAAIAGDVARAVWIGTALWLLKLLAFAVPFASLSRAYGLAGGRGVAATRAMFYRVWIVPAAYAFVTVVGWLLPPAATPFVAQVEPLLVALPLLLLAVTMRGTARDAAVAGPWVSWVVVLVALAVGMTVGVLVDRLASPFLPHVDAPAQRAVSANGSPA